MHTSNQEFWTCCICYSWGLCGGDIYEDYGHDFVRPCMVGKYESLASFLMRTRNPWMPWCTSPMMSCAKTTAHLACTALLVIQYFCARVAGVRMINSSEALSNVAVVCISTALLPMGFAGRIRQFWHITWSWQSGKCLFMPKLNLISYCRVWCLPHIMVNRRDCMEGLRNQQEPYQI